MVFADDSREWIKTRDVLVGIAELGARFAKLTPLVGNVIGAVADMVAVRLCTIPEEDSSRPSSDKLRFQTDKAQTQTGRVHTEKTVWCRLAYKVCLKAL